MSDKQSKETESSPQVTGTDGWPLHDDAPQVQAVAKSLGLMATNGMSVTAEMDDDEDSLAAEASSSSSTVPIDPKVLRGYSWSPPLPWSTFLRLRRSWGQIKLTPAQEQNVFKALEKIPQGVGKIHDSLPFVSAFIDKHCPELRHKSISVPRPGTTFLLLSVITGNVQLCEACVKLGANPNSCKFLTDLEAHDNQMRHGYSPMFIACICEQLEIMSILRKNGGCIHVIDRWGRTPLHAAAAMGSTEVLEWLIHEGAPRKAVDVDLRMPGELCLGKVIPQLQQPSLLFRSAEDATGCHCGSGRARGACGCLDDMHDVWYADRLRSQWSVAVRSIPVAFGSSRPTDGFTQASDESTSPTTPL
jgi:hypothetical protein